MYAAQAGKMAADCAEGQLRLLNTLMKIYSGKPYGVRYGPCSKDFFDVLSSKNGRETLRDAPAELHSAVSGRSQAMCCDQGT